MATKENLRTRLARVRAEVIRTGQLVLEGPVLSGTVQGASHFLLGAVLAGGKLFGSCAPFGVALVGGSGSGLCAAMALLGSSFGYLTLLGLVEGLRYVSAAILTFSLAFAFYDVKLYHLPWTMPAAAALMNACTGFVYLSQRGWRTQDVICYVTEVALTAVAAYGFREVLDEERRTHSRWWVLLAGAVYITLSQQYIYADVSLGRWLTAVTVLACGWQAGVGVGAGVGVALGLGMDLAAQGSAVYTMAFGAAGLA
ncbi:MAG: stage II sporulation protein E, partial [Oscillospiraceae bacterium]|nr:stage II sporulation protein E [Oscillospiraceae bacterium]